MGREKYVKDIERLFEKSPVVDFASIERAIKSKKAVKGYSKLFVSNLLKKGKIKRIAKGCYTKHENTSLSVFCFTPSYLGLQDALSMHNLWEQETIPIIITARKIRQGVREIIETNVMIKRMDKKYFFGFNYYKEGEFYLPYSDIEKTFIDMIYFRENLDKEVLDEIRKRMDKKKLGKYLKKYPKRFRERVRRVEKGE